MVNESGVKVMDHELWRDISGMVCEKDCVFTPADCFENCFVHILLILSLQGIGGKKRRGEKVEILFWLGLPSTKKKTSL